MVPLGQAIKEGLLQLASTFNEIRKLKVVFTFLLAYWLYIDGVDTIIAMAADYGKRIGFNQNDLFMAFLVTQFVGFPAAILYGKLGEKLGARSALLIANCRRNLNPTGDTYSRSAMCNTWKEGSVVMARSSEPSSAKSKFCSNSSNSTCSSTVGGAS